jgi:hypothetical protein
VRTRGYGTLMLLLVVSVGLLLPNALIPEAVADIAPFDYFSEPGVIPSSFETKMPSANVSIKAIVTGSFTYDVTSNCTFDLLSNCTMNCSLAFVYPLIGLTDTEYNSSLTVRVDDELTDHEVLNWTDLQSAFHVNWSEVPHFNECAFAVFNITLNANETSTVAVGMRLHLISTGYYFTFNYAIGTGRYWAGNTFETVRIEVEDRAGLLGLTFYPQPNSTESSAASTAVALWSCSVDYLDSFYVGFTAYQQEYHGLYPPAPLWYWLALVGIAAVPCTLVAFVLLKRRSSAL